MSDNRFDAIRIDTRGARATEAADRTASGPAGVSRRRRTQQVRPLPFTDDGIAGGLFTIPNAVRTAVWLS
ncbi:MAG: hypothetical protein AcusKO_44660 [Acuticoccus sp.]